MSSPEEPRLPPIAESAPNTEIPPIIQDDNPFRTPQASNETGYPTNGIGGKSVALGGGYWICVVASVFLLAFLLVSTPETSIVVGWILFFAAIRVPLRDARRQALNYPPTFRRFLFGAGDYVISLLLCSGITFAMGTVFLTVCTVTGLGLSAMSINEPTFISFALGSGGLAAITTFFLLFVMSLRM